jgi:AcrR family transcriptional regulator
MAKAQLTSEDWIKAGFRALTRAGPQAIRVEPIARDLSVSKGSFYWHFKDLAALKAAMLSSWETHATGEVIAAIQHMKGSAHDRLDALIAQSSQMRTDVGGAGAEPAIIDWARYDPLAADAVQKVTKQRIAYLTTLFAEAGPDAERHAQLFYATYLGMHHIPTDRAAILTVLRDKLLP